MQLRVEKTVGILLKPSQIHNRTKGS